MAGQWRDYRLIVVEEQRFRWKCDFHDPSVLGSTSYAKHGSTWAPDTLTVRVEDQPNQVLSVTWPACHGPIVLPAFVRACIEQALRDGWLRERPALELVGESVPN